MLVVLLTAVIFVHAARSELLLTLTPELVEPGFTSLFTLRCSFLEQEEANVRDVTIYRTPVTSRNATRELVAEIHGIAPSTPRVAAGFENVTVRGQISQFELEIGTYLELVWPEPKIEDLGLYTCESTSFVEEALITLFAQVRVTTSNPTSDRLLAALQALETRLNSFNVSLQEIKTDLDQEAQNVTDEAAPAEGGTEETIVDGEPTEEGTEEERSLEWLKETIEALGRSFEAFNETVTRLIEKIDALTLEDDKAQNETAPDEAGNNVVLNSFLYGNSSYVLLQSDKGSNTSTAEIVCDSKGQYIAEINDQEEFQAVSDELLRSLPDGGVVLVGGRRSPDQPWVFQTSQGEVTFFAWGSAKPAESAGDQCLALQRSGEVLEMTAVDCSSSVENAHVLCEQDE